MIKNNNWIIKINTLIKKYTNIKKYNINVDVMTLSDLRIIQKKYYIDIPHGYNTCRRAYVGAHIENGKTNFCFFQVTNPENTFRGRCEQRYQLKKIIENLVALKALDYMFVLTHEFPSQYWLDEPTEKYKNVLDRLQDECDIVIWSDYYIKRQYNLWLK